MRFTHCPPYYCDCYVRVAGVVLAASAGKGIDFAPIAGCAQPEAFFIRGVAASGLAVDDVFTPHCFPQEVWTVIELRY